MDKVIKKERYETDLARQCEQLGWCDRDSCYCDLNESAVNGYHYKEVDGGTFSTKFLDGKWEPLVFLPGQYEGECDASEVMTDAQGLLKTAHLMASMELKHNLLRMKPEHRTTIGGIAAASGTLRLELVEREGQPSRVRIEPAGIELTQDQAGTFVYAVRDAAYAAYQSDVGDAAMADYTKDE